MGVSRGEQQCEPGGLAPRNTVKHPCCHGKTLYVV